MTSFNSRYHGNSTRETLFFVCCLNVHGIFTDYTDRTKAAVDLTFHNPQICSDICPSKFSSSLLQIPSSTTHSRIFEKWELSTILYYLLILLVLFYFRTSIKFNFRATVYWRRCSASWSDRRNENRTYFNILILWFNLQGDSAKFLIYQIFCDYILRSSCGERLDLYLVFISFMDFQNLRRI